MTAARTTLSPGKRVALDTGTAVPVKPIQPTGVTFRDPTGNDTHITWDKLGTVRAINDGVVAALADPLRPIWDALDENARNVALMRLEVVQEILTGFRDGHPEFARPGEPREPFRPGNGLSESARANAMAELVSHERQADRILQRRVRDGEIRATGCNPSTIRKWLHQYKESGLLGLIDGRSIRPSKLWELIDPRYREVAERVLATFDGDRSSVSIQEIDRRILTILKKEGAENLRIPKRITAQYLSSFKRARGATTRAQRSAAASEVSGTQHYPGLRPGQVVATDVTRADNLVYDPDTGQPISVEIITAICIATRVVLALRVVPRSANGTEAGLVIYDVCRPFSQVVEGTSISDWRWCGLPEQLDLASVAIQMGKRRYAPNITTVQGEHGIPSVRPDAIHSDSGAIFLCTQNIELLDRLGIDLVLNRIGKPSDNSHIERWHETIQRCLQGIPGYKGRHVAERGRFVAEEPLLTAAELQERLRWFVALDYHRSSHEGVALPGMEKARFTPLDVWDAMVEATGRIDVPQQPDLIYQFLPIRWGTIGRAGVEFFNMTFDSPVLDNYRHVAPGFFRHVDSAAPFYIDERDLSRIWFRDPSTKLVEEIPWRGANRINAPMTKVIVNEAKRLIRQRGGNLALKRGMATQQIIDELTELTTTPISKAWDKKLGAARHRAAQSRIDHDEAQHARDERSPTPPPNRMSVAAALRRPWPDLLEEE
jgi:transposase InsO family protein